MPELDHHPEHESHYNCEYCRDTGKLDGSDCYDCAHCSVAEKRTKLDERTAAMGRMTINDIAWSHVQLVKREIGAKRAAEVALLQAKLRQAERELAEVRKDAQRYRWLRDIGCDTFEPYQHSWCRSAAECDAQIDAAMSTPNKGESK